MSRIMDVDEAILCHALKLLTAVQRREPEVHVDLLEDIPRLIVHLFEHVTTEPIPDNLKPFGNFRERSDTLQMILDTLEQTLGLSMSHVTGVGLAQLDRRQLADALAIFDNLLRYCRRSGDKLPTQQADDSSGGRLTMSLLNSPESASKEYPTRDRHTDQPSGQASRNNSVYNEGGTRGLHANEPALLRRTYHYKNSGRSPIVEVRPMAPAVWQNKNEKRTRNTGEEPPISRQRPPISRGTSKNFTESTHSIASTKSSTTLAKELYRHNEALPTYVQDQIRVMTTPKQVKDVLKHDNVNHRWFSPEVCDISELSTHDQKHTPGTAPKGTIQERYTPYRSTKEKPMAKGVKSGAPVRVRKPSVKSFSASRGISETLARQKRDAAPKYPPSDRPIKDSSLGSKKGDTRVGKEGGPERSRNTTVALNKPATRDRLMTSTSGRQQRSPPTRSVHKGNVHGSKKDIEGRTTRLQSSRKVNVSKGTSRCETREDSVMTSESYPGLSRKRRPSILSTKVRKHSNNSPIMRDSSRGVVLRQSVKRGHVSPQTTSLYSSFKLLEEFDYVRRRLKEIQQIKQEHLDAIADLDREKVRLEAVLAHVHTRSRVTDQAVVQ